MELGRTPRVGDKLEVVGDRFEVLDMDRNRVDKLLVAQADASPGMTTRSSDGSISSEPSAMG
ncbi:MAG: transporter associated domain-containing protein [Burkholderiales bacterium]|jgi:CBS domain containing-hemolysin-like protein